MSDILEGQKLKILKETLNKETELISQIKYKLPEPNLQQDRASTTLIAGTSNSGNFDNNESKETLMEPSQNILHENLLELNPSIHVIINENKLMPHIPAVKKDIKQQHHRSSSTSRRGN